jgi:hypothetical protein
MPSLRHLILVFLLFSLIQGTFVVGTDILVSAMSYQQYQQWVDGKDGCDSPAKSWNKWGTKLIGKIDYPELSVSVVSINEAIKKWKNEGTNFSGAEKERLMMDLNLARIGNFSGFKALEVARIGYRTQMNRLFACAIIDSRLSSIVWLTEKINKKIKNKPTEFTDKLEKEAKKYERLKGDMKCNSEIGGKFDIGSLTDTAAYQYCRYRYYLDYLDSNTVDVLALQKIEQWIGTGNGTSVATDISEYAKQNNIYSSSIAREITRADTTLPKALRTFLEMDQTYQIHILLADFIYADYINLRKSIAYYMVLSSQLYQKAYNAQSTNK